MLERSRVLFVDDEENVRKALRRLFRREPWESCYAASADEALRLFESTGAFDVVVSDHRMPGMTGVELLKVIRARYPATVRIVLSSYTDVDVVLDAINEGFVYKFLTKTCSDKVLRETVAEVVEAVQLRRENRRLAERLRTQEQEVSAVHWLVDELEGLDLSPSPVELLTAAVNALPVGVALVDRGGRVVFANPAAGRRLGKTSPSELLGLPMDTDSLGAGSRCFPLAGAPEDRSCLWLLGEDG